MAEIKKQSTKFVSRPREERCLNSTHVESAAGNTWEDAQASAQGSFSPPPLPQ